ncbi:hypothetical protein E3T25_16110 [Cryobacterium sandaracinum]|uniref:Uncharacterized protein n=1 Tax=Cryobacterium sandaracinum TaxID=1259247 RepID=A0ABY2J2M4_9MICO|nr:hypothetical protein [Cryobacterium sandaracinum]TFC99189.1 hypothetical protein E3T25_16110 [Cryobacterium sandaracinum]
MTDARFRPRDFALTPDRFGRPTGIEWKSIQVVDWVIPEDPAELQDLRRRYADWRTNAWRLQAAQMQHYYAMRIRRAIAEGTQVKGRGMTRSRVYAQMAGISYDRLVKMLRGEVIMRLEDVAAADRMLGDISGFTRGESLASEDDPSAAALPAASMGEFPDWART